MKKSHRYILMSLLVSAFLFNGVGCSCSIDPHHSSTSVVVPELKEYVSLYETTGTKAKMLAQQDDLVWEDYQVTGNNEIHIDPHVEKEELTGMGLAITHSSAYLLQTMSEENKEKALQDLFSFAGANLNCIRIPLGTSDYTYTDEFYTFDDVGFGQKDYQLVNFSIAKDEDYLIPTLKEILLINPDIIFFAAPWSAPAWMKTTKSLKGGSLIAGDGANPSNEEITYADYLLKAVQAYQSHGINIKYLSLVNEPNVGFLNYPCMSMGADQFARVALLLGRKIKAAKLDTTILAYDHNAGDPSDDAIFAQWLEQLENNPEIREYVSSFGFHCYSQGWQNNHRTFIENTRQNAPRQKVFVTEVTESEGSGVDFALNVSWSMKNVTVGPIAGGASAALYWNAILRENGEPILGNDAVCYGVLTYNGEHIIRNAAYYSLAHTAKYAYKIDGINPIRLDTYADNEAKIKTTSFRRADNAVVTVIVNNDATTFEEVTVVYNDTKMLTVTVQAESAMTLVSEAKEKEEGYHGIHVRNFTFEQRLANTYDFTFTLSHFDKNMNFYLTREQEEYQEEDLITYETVREMYTFSSEILAGDYTLYMVLGDLFGEFNFTIPKMNPKVETQTDGSILIDFGFDHATSWSSYCDPYGKNIYRSSKIRYDETAELVNIDTDGNPYPIYIVDESFTDNHPNDDKPVYFLVLTSKNKLGTIISYPLMVKERLIADVHASLIVKDDQPTLAVKPTLISPVTHEMFQLVVKDNVDEVHLIEYDSVDGDGTFYFDLTNLLVKGRWYDILLEYKTTANRYDLLKEDADLSQQITVGGNTYEFKEWEGLLKVNWKE